MEKSKTELNLRHGIFNMAVWGRPDQSGKKSMSFNSRGYKAGKDLPALFAMGPDEAFWLGKENFFYSIASLRDTYFAGRGRKGKNASVDMAWQEWLPFDIDKLEMGDWTPEGIVYLVEEVMPTDGQRLYVWSGHGIQMQFRIPAFSEVGKFKDWRFAYRDLTLRIDQHLRTYGLKFERVDPTAWDSTRVFRLPGTVNQKYNDDGTPKDPKKCYLIADVGQGVSYKLQNFLDTYQAPEEFAEVEESTAVSKLLTIFDAGKIKDYGGYVKVVCPFHSDGQESDPSLVIYKDNFERAFDMHCAESDPERKVPLFKVWMTVLYPGEDSGKVNGSYENNPRWKEFRKFLGMPVREPVIVVIRNYWEETILPLYKDGGSIYSLAEQKLISKSDARDLFSPELRDRIISLSEEALKFDPKAKEYYTCSLVEAQKMYSFNCGYAFANLLQSLPAIQEVDPEDIPGRAKEDAMMVIRNAFSQAVPITMNKTSTRMSLLKLSQTSPWDEESWISLDAYDFYYRRLRGKLQIAFKFGILLQLPTSRVWAEQFRRREFDDLMVALGICTREVVSVSGVKHRVIKLTDEALEAIENPDSVEFDPNAMSPVAQFMNEVKLNG